MSAFEFFFSLFGLVLGLAIANVASGMADVLRERKRIPLGLLTPMLATVVLFDLASFWVNGWRSLQGVHVAYGSVNAAVAVAVIYFFASSVIFPKNASEWPSLDDYYRGHYRWVLGGVVAANLGLVMIGAVYTDLNPAAYYAARLLNPGVLLFYLTLVVMLITSRRRVQLVGLAVLLLQTVYGVFGGLIFQMLRQ